MSRDLNLYCVARNRGAMWEAFCLDFDLAVQGRTFEEVRQHLSHAVMEYVAEADQHDAQVRDRLLSRKAPLSVRALWRWRLALAAIFGGGDNEKFAYGFPVSCHA